MFQITEFHPKKRMINTEWGRMDFLSWLKKESQRIKGWNIIKEKERNMVALFYKKDRRQNNVWK